MKRADLPANDRLRTDPTDPISYYGLLWNRPIRGIETRGASSQILQQLAYLHEQLGSVAGHCGATLT